VVLAPIFQYRYSPAAKLFKKALEAGRFGKLLLASAKIKWFRPQSYYDSGAWRGTWAVDGGGCLMNQSIHAIDLFLHFAGRPTEVYGYWDTMDHERIEVEDNAAAVVKFANGAFGTIESSTCCQPGWPLEVEVSGTRGTATIVAQTIARWDFRDEDPLDAEARVFLETPAESSGASDPSSISTEGHQAVIEDMVRTILTGKDLVIPGEEAKLPLQVICGIYEAKKTGVPTKL
jgi:predicted dehydrogenase